jgi:hypothetical protein
LVDAINSFGTFDDDIKSKLPVFEMICEGDFPIEETLLPLFKRKVINYINQKSNKQTIKEIKE